MQQFHRLLKLFLLGAVSLILGACSGGPAARALPGGADRTTFVVASQSSSGHFTAYALPLGSHPGALTRGAYGTLYTVDIDEPFVYRMQSNSGAVTTLPVRNQLGALRGDVVAVSRRVWYLASAADPPLEDFLVGVSPEGTFTFLDLGIANANFRSGLTVGSDGKIWFQYCLSDPNTGLCAALPNSGVVASVSTAGALGPKVHLTGYFIGENLAPGPDGNIYVTARYIGQSTPQSDSAVFVVSTSGTLLRRFTFPNGSIPSGITTGPDRNLWIAESGSSKIARMTTAGTITQFIVPTRAASPSLIIEGSGNTLWFNEPDSGNVNKIGSITTSGSIREYQIPNPGAFLPYPSGLAPCTTVCAPAGGVWFIDSGDPNHNFIGKFVL